MYFLKARFAVVFSFNTNHVLIYLQLVVTFTCLLYVGAYQALSLMGKAKYTETGALIDAGMDLNAESGTAE